MTWLRAFHVGYVLNTSRGGFAPPSVPVTVDYTFWSDPGADFISHIALAPIAFAGSRLDRGTRAFGGYFEAVVTFPRLPHHDLSVTIGIDQPPF